MKLIYTFVVEIDVHSLEDWKDTDVEGDVPITTIQQAAEYDKAALESGALDPIDVLCGADSYIVTVQGVE